MFNTVQVGRKIKELRVKNNMTQMNLADAMGVSYQAVSNWERGNSMPDISKLAELASILQCTIDELLGNSKETELVKTTVEMDEHGTVPIVAPDLETLANVAPILKPNQTAALTEMVTETAKSGDVSIDLAQLVGLAPFLDDDLLCDLLESALQGNGKADIHTAIALAPFLNDQALDKLVEKLEPQGLSGVLELAPFLSDETLDKLVENARGDMQEITALAPFLSDKALGKLADKADGDMKSILPLAPFMDEKDLDRLVKRAMEKDFSARELAPLAPFLEEETLDAVVDKMAAEGKTADCSPLFPFLSEKALHTLLQAMLKKGDMGSMKEIAHFL